MDGFSWDPPLQQNEHHSLLQDDGNHGISQMTEDSASTISRPASIGQSMSTFNLANVGSIPWKTHLQHSVNFDMVAPGLITLLGFDGIEMWGMDTKVGSLVMLADVVRDESLLNWSKYSAVYRFHIGKGMVGRVFCSGLSEWKSDVTREGKEVFHRTHGARRLGIKGVGCMRCNTNFGVEVVIFLYSRKELAFSKDRISFIEGMISKWIRSGKDSNTFYSANNTSTGKTAVRFLESPKQKSQKSQNHLLMETSEMDISEAKNQGSVMRLMVLDLFLSSFGGITKHLRFDGSEIWIEDAPGSCLLQHGGTIATKPLHKEWATYSTRFKFGNDRSMIGRVLSTTRPEWQPDVSHLSVSIFTRASGARRYGIRGMCGVYCRTRQGLQFVIGLFSGNRVTFTKERKKAILKMVEVWAQGSVPGPEKPIKIISRGDSFIVPEATGSPVFATNVSLNKWVDMQGDVPKFNGNGSVHSNRSAPGSKRPQSLSSNSAPSRGKRGKPKCRYVCDYCDKVFHKKGNWQAHLRTHTKEKPFACSACGRQFTQKSNMKRHMLKIHKIPKDYPGPGIHQSTSMPTLPEQKDMSKPGPGFFVQDPGANTSAMLVSQNPSGAAMMMNSANSPQGVFPWMRTT
ncbi:hypothetical protein AAMO2058_001263500 [Amorphochlora amoebiformis]